MSQVEDTLKRNLAEVEARIADACRRAGRSRAEVTLVAVTKYADVEACRVLHGLGVSDLGESRPQELWRKAAAIPHARWHLVGHLQRNKIDRTLPVVQLVHSVDSLRLLDALEAEAGKQGRKIEVLLEFNLSGEGAKHGFFAAPGISELAAVLDRLRHVRIRGLMTMAALSKDPEDVRPTFAALRDLRDRLEPMLREDYDVRHLSMGMTNDFEIAIEEGATLVRIGTALFRGLGGLGGLGDLAGAPG